MKHRIEVIGLGAGDIEQLPLGIYRKLTSIEKMHFTRTLDHPVITNLKEEGVNFTSFDYLYQREKGFETVYEEIVKILLEHAQEKSIIYSVPGHPMLAEKTVQLLLNQEQVEIEIVGGQSYLDPLFASLKIDPIEGFQFIDATGFKRSTLNYEQHLIFCQVYDRFIASEVKLTLLEDLPAEYPITIIDAAGSHMEKITTVPLEELDHSIEVSNLTSVYVPPANESLRNHMFTRLREVIATLRGPSGCPWDKEQTHESLREYAIEEVYELLEAIDEQDDEAIVEELGDVLLQVMLHSQIGEDDGYFSIDDVIKSITDKMIYRHPHVFSTESIDNVDDVITNWEALKKEEKKDTRNSLLDGIPKGLPALLKAYKLQKKAAKVGFDWDKVEDIWKKLDEEIQEVRQAIVNKEQVEIEKEFGDVLFVLANLTRYYQINPENALSLTNQKFIDRFSYIEKELTKQGKELIDSSLKEMDNLWNQAKERE
ncbi:nucleoside triphosphate pyrophosphohydrolase [Ornithinibacillus halotolerans]|uniref:MazG family protein n=1 Tax=Ornithinibacillus halotolerans TaxID=1274357 RepID=A0A916W6F7_9BACI|nr:nucleoside triphosphate pyrophosphohydrolase [Ornithinibacillus halotolerans]GGA70943.1 MazG family protein [Ornithinibacillus halotolerans]